MLGRTLVIANPAAQLGRGYDAALRAERLLREREGACTALDVVFTDAAGDARGFAAGSAGYDTIVCVGGDGTIHEVGNGLMGLARDERPRLGVVPMGSGNDYARTLGMSFTVDEAVAQLCAGRAVSADVGTCNGVCFMETISFGLDAGIALDTQERRLRTGTTGLRLYAASCADQLLHHKRDYGFTLCVDGGAPERGMLILMAVQIGPSYGSGFKVCPEARLDDGLLDVCIAHAPIGTLRGAFIFLRAKNGHHERFKGIDIRTARSLELSFDQTPPVQIDGERYQADAYSLGILAEALDVIVAPEKGVR